MKGFLLHSLKGGLKQTNSTEKKNVLQKGPKRLDELAVSVTY